jgi:DNA-binding winged helix-turn-helix (wHTH) protein/TolB-like protein
MEPATAAHIFRFGLFEADDVSNTLTRSGARVKIQDQPFRVLIVLLERPGNIVTREELRRKLWPEGTYVDFEGSLNVTMRKLRDALRDDPDNPRFIETVPRHGYRFIAPVSVGQSSQLPEAAKEDSNSSQVTGSKLPPVRLERARSWRVPASVAFAFILLVLLVGWRYTQRNRPVATATRTVVAVLPFVNEGAGPDFDYLRYAIANDLVTDLTYTRSVTVRPFASTSRYGSQPVDPATVGEALRVTHVVAGGFLIENKNLRVNIELVDVMRNQAVWREEVTVSPQQLVALHDRLAARAAQGLLPAMNVVDTSFDEIPVTKNEEALNLFLHSLTIPIEPEPNRLAIEKLEESVSLDGGYAPAWGELGWRYYLDYHYGEGGEAAMQAAAAKSLQAYKRQSELDPNTPPVWTTIRVEQGDLNGAYDQAAAFLRRRPDSSTAHFGMSYVLRYAGLLDEAGKECDAALALDPGFNGFRSCATPFFMAGDYAHAQRYINLVEGSGFAALLRLRIALRTGDNAAVLADTAEAVQSGFQGADVELAFFRTCLNHGPEAELRKAVAKMEANPILSRDAELFYQNAEALGFCGQGDAALRQLRKAIQGNHCSYPAMDKDPQFDSIRRRPEFAELRQAAIQCQQNFLAHRQQIAAASAATQ